MEITAEVATPPNTTISVRKGSLPDLALYRHTLPILSYLIYVVWSSQDSAQLEVNLYPSEDNLLASSRDRYSAVVPHPAALQYQHWLQVPCMEFKLNI